MTAQVLQFRQAVRRGPNPRRDGFDLRPFYAALITILMEWYAAFALMVTLIWLYIEMLCWLGLSGRDDHSNPYRFHRWILGSFRAYLRG
jgi:hypothetical protein